MQTRVGDKVRFKTPPHSGKRGVVVEINSCSLVVEVEDNDTVVARLDEVTNLSRAARKAWQSMPNREVGRPKGSRVCDRVSVTLRVDRKLWDKFRELEAAGQISDRTTTVNAWLQAGIARLENNGKSND